MVIKDGRDLFKYWENWIPVRLCKWESDKALAHLNSKPVEFLRVNEEGKLEFAKNILSSDFQQTEYAFKGIVLEQGENCFDTAIEISLSEKTDCLLLVNLNTNKVVEGWNNHNFLNDLDSIRGSLISSFDEVYLLVGYFVKTNDVNRLLSRNHSFSSKISDYEERGAKTKSNGKFVDELMPKYTIDTLILGHHLNAVGYLDIPPLIDKVETESFDRLFSDSPNMITFSQSWNSVLEPSTPSDKIVYFKRGNISPLKVSQDYVPTKKDNYIRGVIFARDEAIVELAEFFDSINLIGANEHYIIYIPSRRWLIKSWHLPAPYRFNLSAFFTVQNSISTPEYLKGAILVKVIEIKLGVE